MGFSAVKLSDRVYWVGAVDWTVRDFHGYSTSRGTTYNAYLVLDEKITLIDTVKAPFKEEMLARIATVVAPADIDYIISNHAEMDHSGALPLVIDVIKPEKIFASIMGAKALEEHFHLGREVVAVKDGESLPLGKLTVKFFETRMLHWPDSMVSYIPDERLLFSQDGFGMHLASSERFADEIPLPTLKFEAAKYYANILLPYSSLVLKLLERIREVGLEVNIIAPDHGPIWRKEPLTVVSWYKDWAEQRPTAKAVVVYDTMWQSTDLMARAIAEGIAGEGINVKLMRLRANDRSDVMTEMLDAGLVVLGSPTLNNGLFPTVADMLVYMKGLKPKNKVGAAFGSYGWSGEAAALINDELRAMGVEVIAEPLKVKYVPDENNLQQCWNWGRGLGQRLKERIK